MNPKDSTMRSGEFDAVLPELERLLITTAAAQAKPSKSSFARRIGRRGATRPLAIAVACLVFGGSAMAATGVWNPPIGTDTGIEGEGPPLSGEGPPTLATTPVPAAETAVLGVLRRDPTAQDRGAEVEATLANVAFIDRVRPDSVRILAPGDRGKATIVLSAERSLDTELTGGEPICVFRPGALGYGHVNDVPSACFGLSDLLAGRAYTEEINTPPGQGLAYGLVPDGVASVTAEFADAPDVTVPVTDNYFEIPMSGAQVGEGKGDLKGGVRRVIWHNADGALVPQGPSGTDASGKPGFSMEQSGTPGSITERITEGGGQSLIGRSR